MYRSCGYRIAKKHQASAHSSEMLLNGKCRRRSLHFTLEVTRTTEELFMLGRHGHRTRGISPCRQFRPHMHQQLLLQMRASCCLVDLPRCLGRKSVLLGPSEVSSTSALVANSVPSASGKPTTETDHISSLAVWPFVRRAARTLALHFGFRTVDGFSDEPTTAGISKPTLYRPALSHDSRPVYAPLKRLSLTPPDNPCDVVAVASDQQRQASANEKFRCLIAGGLTVAAECDFELKAAADVNRADAITPEKNVFVKCTAGVSAYECVIKLVEGCCPQPDRQLCHAILCTGSVLFGAPATSVLQFLGGHLQWLARLAIGSCRSVFELELFRLASLIDWPHLGKMSALRCSSAGFYRNAAAGTTSARDGVACFSCGCTVQQWTPNMQPMALHRKKCDRHCRFVAEPRISGNVPMGKGLINLHDSEHASESLRPPSSLIDSVLSTGEKPHADEHRSPSLDIMPCSPLAAPAVGVHAEAGLATVASDSHRMEEQKVSYRRTGESSSFVDLPLAKREPCRLNTFTDVWAHGHTVDVRELARNGFFYAGPLDRVRCAFCKGFLRNWEQGDRVDERHAQHFACCPFVQGRDVGNVPVASWPLAAKETPEARVSETTDAKRTDLVTTRTQPRNPEFSVDNRRLLTFFTSSATQFLQPEAMAKAGFFYIGEEVAVRCFCCDGVVEDWQPGGDPWVVHAQRFPTCSFLLDAKGHDFVRSVHHAPSSNALGMSMPQGWCIRTHQACDEQTSNLLRINAEMSFQDDVRARMDSKAVRIVLQMDYPHDLIREVVQKRLTTFGSDHKTSEHLLEDVFRTLDEKQNASRFRNAEDNKHLKTQLTCKVCLDSIVGIVFLPCGHLVCCASCAADMTTCPICRVSIRGAVRAAL